MLELIEKLVAVPAGSGFEDAMGQEMARAFEAQGLSVTVDPMGNVIGAFPSPGKAPSVMICAHMDEVGLLVKYVDEQGFLYLELNGMIDERVLLGTQVDVCSTRGVHGGVIGVRSSHFVSPQEAQRPLNIYDLWLDVGARSRDEVRGMGIAVGDPVVYRPNFRRLANGHLSSKAIDDRAGCAILINLAQAFKEQTLDYRLWLVGTVQEEIGSRGAKVVAQHLQPDIAVVMDTVPGMDPSTRPPQATVKVGDGPVLRVMDARTEMSGTIYAEPIRRHLAQLADREGIPYQVDVARTWTDAVHIHTAHSGIPTAGIYIPRRCSHSPSEVAHVSDIEAAFALLRAFLSTLDAQTITRLRQRAPVQRW
jgi:endoglucanase